jgi:GAF domain-containing protein
MGDRSRGFFDEAERLGGLVGKIRLASVARVTSAEAASGEDNPAVVERLERAMRQLRAELEKSEPIADPLIGRIARARAGADDARILRRHLQIYVDLMTQRSLYLGNVDSTIRRIDEAAADTIDVARVSVWYLDDASAKITCADLFERETRKHSSGVELFARDFAPYFQALRFQRTIAAHDAHTDPRTSCFSASYLTPLGINSMLDVPIWVGQKMAGVICHEHVGQKRTWNSDEETFAYLMSNFVALALERNAPGKLPTK